MKKKKLLFVVAGVVVGALVLLAAFLLFGGIARLKATQNKLEDAELELRRYYAKDPFPSTQNVASVQANVRTLDEWQGKLMEKLMAGQVLPDNTRSPSAFISLLEQQRLALLALGGKGESVEETFAFGFDRYFAADGVRPVPADVPRLTQQLLIISDVCKVLFGANIIKLKRIERDRFEGGVASGRTKGPRADPDVGILKEGDLFTPLNFQFQFETREAALLDALNRLTRHSMFVVISNMEARRTVPDVIIPEEEEAGEEGDEDEGGEDSAGQPGVAGAALEALSRIERTVSGSEMEQPLNVTLELAVYRFREIEQEQE